MILTIGYLTERTFSHVVSFLTKNKTGHRVLDLSSLQNAASIEIEENFQQGNLLIRVDGHVYDFAGFDAYYLRLFYVSQQKDELNVALSKLISAVYSFAESTRKLVVNRPTAGASNINKFQHLRELQKYGFKIIPTFILGNVWSAQTLLDPDGRYIVKGCSSMKTKTALVDPYMYSRIRRLGVAPALFQPRIIGDEVRVHFVGDRFFAERIKSARLDYRFAEEGTPANKFAPCLPPPQVIAQCIHYCQAEQLYFAGFDFKVTAEGEWYIFECNPMPGYESYDKRVGTGISAALVDLLTGKTTPFPDVAPQQIEREPFIPAFNRPDVTPS